MGLRANMGLQGSIVRVAEMTPAVEGVAPRAAPFVPAALRQPSDGTAQSGAHLLTWLLALAPLVALLAAFALRLQLLGAFPLRDDEALYSSWALAARSDPFFLTTFPDKPPLFLWLQAATLRLFGATAAGARLLSLAASTLTVALALPAACRLCPRAQGAGLVALWLLALSPFAISFGPTAYTDSLLVLFVTAALTLGLRGRWGVAGAALGAAIATKQQGLLAAPLILLLPLVVEDAALPADAARPRLRALLYTLGGLALLVAPLLLWDAARWATAPSPWELGVQNYGALRLTPPSTWPARAADWAEPLWQLAASPWAWLLLLGAIGAALAAGFWRRELRPAAPVWLLAGWSAGFLLLHLLTTVQPWDRYLLPLAPILALLAAGPLAAGLAALGWRGLLWGVAGALLLSLVLLPPALTAARGGLPIGGDHGALAGLEEMVAQVRTEAQAAASAGDPAPALYQQRLGWQLGFYLADSTGTGAGAGAGAPPVDLRWFASPVALADSAAKSPGRALLLAEPAWAPAGNLAPALRARGLALQPLPLPLEGNVRLYRIAPLPEATRACDWCVNRPLAPAAASKVLP